MKTVFADTFYFLALLNASDHAHGRADAFTSSFTGRLLTTGWVLAGGRPQPGFGFREPWVSESTWVHG